MAHLSFQTEQTSAECAVTPLPCAIREQRIGGKQSGPCTCSGPCVLTWTNADGTIGRSESQLQCGHFPPLPRRVVWRAKWERFVYGLRVAFGRNP